MPTPPVLPPEPPYEAPSGPDPEFLTPVGREIRDRVAEIVPVLRQEGTQSEELGSLTPTALKALDSTGAFRIAHPLEYGGHALGARDIAEIIATAARGDGSAGWTVWAGTGIRLLLGYPKRTVDELFAVDDGWVGPLTCNASILDIRGGRARRTQGGWLVSGDWRFASSCGHAAWAMVGVEFHDEGGRPQRGTAIIPREQYHLLDDWHVMGLKASNSNGITVDGEVFVPEHRFADMADFPRRMAELPTRYDGLGLRYGPSAGAVVVALNAAPVALGMAEGALECFVEQARKRVPFGLSYPTVAEMPTAQVTAARAQAMISAARSLIHGHADTLDWCAQVGADIGMERSSAISMDLVYSVRLCADAIDMLQIALGSSTVSLRNPIQRFARDARVMATHRMFRLEEMAEMRGRSILGVAQPELHHRNAHRTADVARAQAAADAAAGAPRS
ncbi:acyl-CoA dehydrogenase family protein [Streptomyces sp. NPDC058464]|uniref:acyl-CoA dehydrogenase family protein n=1 Tax=Streptomyces sp. NPDC058464 TaxID=3346511 RepID=UPI003650A72A